MPITLTRRHWISLTVAILLVILAIIYFTFFDQIYAMYLHEFIGPKLQVEYGFTTGRATIPDGKESYQVFVIEYVKTGGKLSESGFQSGDIPVGYKHGFETGSYLDLLAAKQGSIPEIPVINIGDIRNGNWKIQKMKVSNMP